MYVCIHINNESNDYKNVKVIGSAGKTTSRNKFYMNIILHEVDFFLEF